MAKTKRGVKDWHEGALATVGMVYFFSGVIVFYAVASAMGLLDDPIANGPSLVMLGVTLPLPLILVIPRLQPRALKAPSRWYHFFFVVLLATILSASGEFPIALQGLTAGLSPETIARYDSNFLTLVGPIAVLVLIVTSIKMIRRGGTGPTASTSERVQPDEHYREDQSSDAAVRRTGLEKTHLVFIRATGLVMFAAAAYGTATEPNPAIWKAVSAFLALAAAVMFLSPRWTPRVIARPSRWYHFFGFNLLCTALILLALLPYVVGVYGPIIELAAADAQAGITRSPEDLNAAIMPFLTDGPAFIAYLAISLPITLAWFTMIGLLFQKPSVAYSSEALRPYSSQRVSDMPAVGRSKDIRKGKLPEPKLPSIGAAMKLYVAADWLVMRLLGLALLGVAYTIWTLLEIGRELPLIPLSYGQDPKTMMIVYGVLGMFMAVPFLLPRFLTAPRTVAGGLAKAVLLVVTVLFLLPALHVMIDLHTPPIYHATLHATVPNVFKAIAGIAVTSALLISFFRQLGATPKVDYTGKPIVVLSETDLRELRAARMGNNG
ncbi:MAG: hypothetical protein WBA67_10675 [Jannaschia sp.]